MHYFSVESSERANVFSIIAFVSVFFSWGLNKLFGIFSIEVPWWIDAPSVVGFFSIITLIFNQFFWKIKWIRKLLNIITPDVAGNWKGYIKTNFENFEREIPAELVIEQSWMKIIVEFKTSSSSSKSMSANIVRRGEDYEILYSYDNYPKGGQPSTLVPHKGFVIAIYNPIKQTIEGQYFTDPHRKNNGIFEFSKK